MRTRAELEELLEMQKMRLLASSSRDFPTCSPFDFGFYKIQRSGIPGYLYVFYSKLCVLNLVS